MKTVEKQRKKVKETVKEQGKQLNLFEVSTRREVFDAVNVLLNINFDKLDLSHFYHIDVLEELLIEFDKETDIPLEIVAFAFLTIYSGYLCYMDVDCVVVGKDSFRITPDIWNIIVAESGSGKTYVLKKLKEIEEFKESEAHLYGASGSAAFVKALAKYPKGYFVRDEFGEFLHAIKTQSYMREIKDILLRAYNNETIARETKKDVIVAENVKISLLGTTVYESLVEKLEAIDLVDGFAQRFCYVVAKRDERKQVKDYLLYFVKLDRFSKQIEDILKRLQKEYIIKEESFKKVISYTGNLIFKDLNNSFVRRLVFRILKYAFIFHTLIKPEEKVITERSIILATQTVNQHIKDLKAILDDMGLSSLSKKYEKALGLMQRLGRLPTPRELIQNVSSITNASEAKAILQFLSGELK